MDFPDITSMKRIKYSLSEIMEIIGGGTPKTTNPDYWNGDIPWISVKDFNNDLRYVYETEKKITQAGLENSSTKLLNKHDIVLSARGTVGELAMIPFPMAFNQSCYGIRAKSDIVDQIYLYYLLKGHVQSLKKNTHGSVFDTITRDTFASIEVSLPPLPVQKKIAAILSSLDDMIEINTRMNKVLEETARALFHRWFVEFEFPNDEGKPYKSSGGRMIASEMGEIPEGWRVGTVEDVVQIFGGSTPNTKNLDYWENGEHPFCTPKDLSTLSTSILLDTERHITDKGVQTISSKQLPPGTLLLSSRAPVGYLAISAVPISVNQGFIAMVCNETISNVYVLQWIQENMDEIKGRANGSTFLEISKRNFRGIPFLIPAEPVLSSYNRSVKPLYDFVENIVKENVRLRTLRDELLSKLMAS